MKMNFKNNFFSKAQKNKVIVAWLVSMLLVPVKSFSKQIENAVKKGKTDRKNIALAQYTVFEVLLYRRGCRKHDMGFR